MARHHLRLIRLAGSTWPSQRSTSSQRRCLRTGGPRYQISVTYETSIGVSSLREAEGQMSLLADLPAPVSPSRESELAWMESLVSCTNTYELFGRLLQGGSSGKTSHTYLPSSEEALSDSFSQRWLAAGTSWRGECLTLNGSALSNDAVVSSLSDTLETGRVQQRHYLTAKACNGILTRARRREKTLPEQLEQALEEVIGRE